MALSGPLLAGPFVVPSDGGLVLRRHAFPLTVGEMEGLKGRLLRLARERGGATAADRRLVAQLGAVALALSPGDREVGEFLRRFDGGMQQAVADPELRRAELAEVERVLVWLESPAAGGGGRDLAACLADLVGAMAAPDSPRALALRQHGEVGSWRGWVAPLVVFADPVPPVPVANPERPVAEMPLARPPEDPAGEVPAAVAPGETPPEESVVKPVDAAVLGVIAMSPVGKTADWRFARLGVAMTVTRGAGAGVPFAARWVGAEVARHAAGIARAVAAWEASGMAFPAGVAVEFERQEGSGAVLAEDAAADTAALAVLLHAAVVGGTPDPAVWVVADVAEDGSLQIPGRMWGRLKAVLAALPGTKGPVCLVVPREAEQEILPALLTLGRPDFFMKAEVLSASNLGELVQCVASTPEPALRQQRRNFAAIQARCGPQEVGSFIANRFIQGQLRAISEAEFRHASARMLALRSANNHPQFLTAPLLAAEAMSILLPFDPLVAAAAEVDPAALEQAMNACRERLAALERLATPADRRLVELAMDVPTAARTALRALKDRRNTPADDTEALAALKKALEETRKLLDADAAGL